MAAIHVLREQHKSGAPPEQLKILCNDQVAVVRAAARDHWVALGGEARLQMPWMGICCICFWQMRVSLVGCCALPGELMIVLACVGDVLFL